MANVELRAAPTEQAVRPPFGGPAAEGIIRLVTPCTTRDDFATRFARFIDDTSVFVVTRAVVQVGLERRFVFQLADGTVMLEGRARVVDVSTGAEGDGRRRGMRLHLLELSEGSRALHREMIAARSAVPEPVPTPPAPMPSSSVMSSSRPTGSSGSEAPPSPRAGRPPPVPRLSTTGLLPLPSRPGRLPTGTPTPQLTPAPAEERAPGSPFVLPANPLGELSDDTLRSFIECMLYEDALPPRSDTGDAAIAPFAPVPLPAVDPTPVPTPMPMPMPAPPRAAAPALAVADDYEPWPPVRPARGPLAAVAAIAALLGGGAGHVLAAAPTVTLGALAQLVRAAAPGAPVACGAVRSAPARAAAAPASASASSAPAAAPAVAAGPDDAIGDDRCTARVVTTAEDVDVLWNGRSLGATPLGEVAVACGPANVVLTHPRYERIERHVEAGPDQAVEIAVEMRRPSAWLTVSSRPAGAALTVDGIVVRAGQRVSVRGFSHVDIAATMPGYKPWSKRLYVRGSTASTVVELAPIERPRRGAPRPRSAGR